LTPATNYSDSLQGKKIFYFRVHDLEYPRNNRIRSFLQLAGATVDVSVAPKRAGRDRLAPRDAWELFRGALRADIVIVSEFQTKYVPVAWLISRLVGSRLVVDGFVGRFETYVGDWQHVGEGSVKAKIYKIMDSLSVRLSDIFLIDTELRANHIRHRYRTDASGTNRILSLPVGSPKWAVPARARQRTADEPWRVLYYGNYIPLHGVEYVIHGVKWAEATAKVRLTMVGDGVHRPAVENLVKDLELGHAVSFIDPVPEEHLHTLIADHDLVLGIFGTSEKAASVIANKVWQGLSSGRPVLTRESAALAEIRETAGPALIEVPPGDSQAIGAAIIHQIDSNSARLTSGQDLATDLEELVLMKYDIFGSRLAKLGRRRR
jgi:hypothetical protein